MNEGRSNNDVLIGFLFGAAVGAAVAILYAPAAGDETRRRMAETAKRFGSATKDKFGELRETVTNRMSDVRSAAEAGRDEFRRRSQGSTIPSETTPTT